MYWTRRDWILGLLLASTVAWVGCGSGHVEERTIKSAQPVGIDLAKTLLQGYAEGKPVGSEVVGFEQIVEEAKQQDAEKAAILERGFGEIKGLMDSRSAVPNKAKEILAQLEGR